MRECLKNVLCNIRGFKAGKDFEATNIRNSIERPKKAEYKVSDKGKKRQKVLLFSKSIKAQNLKDEEGQLYEAGAFN